MGRGDQFFLDYKDCCPTKKVRILRKLKNFSNISQDKKVGLILQYIAPKKKFQNFFFIPNRHPTQN
jgi:hypothetical protein